MGCHRFDTPVGCHRLVVVGVIYKANTNLDGPHAEAGPHLCAASQCRMGLQTLRSCLSAYKPRAVPPLVFGRLFRYTEAEEEDLDEEEEVLEGSGVRRCTNSVILSTDQITDSTTTTERSGQQLLGEADLAICWQPLLRIPATPPKFGFLIFRIIYFASIEMVATHYTVYMLNAHVI